MTRKRGQITIFIILGIIILLTVILLVIIKERTAIFKPERVIPPEIEPMYSFITTCLETVSKEGIQILGNNGGFIEIPREISIDSFSYLSVTPLFPELKTPLWYYNHENRIPTEEYIKNELKTYIEKNLDKCLEDLSIFKLQYDIDEKSNKSIEIDLQDRATIIKLEWPLEITRPQIQQTLNIEEFTADIPIRLKKAYELAKTIAEKAVNDKFIETKTLTLVDIDAEIPYTDVAFTCSPKIWFVQDIKNRLQNLLAINIPHIKIAKTNFIPPSKDKELFEYSHFIWNVMPTTSDLKVGLIYDRKWPLSLTIRPSDGNILKSEPAKGQELLSLFCMHLYHFTYDIKYPVLISVKDEKAGSHEQFTFNFALQADINHNQPAKAPLGSTIFDFEPPLSASRFCTETLRNTITVYTYENITHDLGSDYEPLDDVEITYTCIRYTCEIGSSEYIGGGAEAIYTGIFPYCINGVLRGQKQGYLKAEKFFTSDRDKDISLYLTPLKQIDYEVVKHYQATAESGLGPETELNKDEAAFISIKKESPSLRTQLTYPGFENQKLPLELLAKADHTYRLEIWLVENDKIIGGYQGNWTVEWDKLARSSKVKFHVIETPYNPDPIGQFTILTTLQQRSKNLPKHELI